MVPPTPITTDTDNQLTSDIMERKKRNPSCTDTVAVTIIILNNATRAKMTRSVPVATDLLKMAPAAANTHMNGAAAVNNSKLCC